MSQGVEWDRYWLGGHKTLWSCLCQGRVRIVGLAGDHGDRVAECPHQLDIIGSTGTDSDNVLVDDCKGEWDGGEAPEITMDLKCMVMVSMLMLRNGLVGGGVKGFTVLGATKIEGAWVQLLQAELQENKLEVLISLD